MNANTAEKIETIVSCFLKNRLTSGTCGTLVEIAADPALNVPHCYRVVTDGLTFIVRCAAEGWRVSFGPMTGCAPDLYTAAQLALDGRKGRNVGTVAQALGWST